MTTVRVLVSVIALFVAGFALQLAYPLSQAAGYHQFADTRSWLGIPNAADVLSNALILFAGVANLGWVSSHGGGRTLMAPSLVVAGLGLVMTGFGSAYYHWAPSDATLVWDRLPLAVVFGGVLLALWSSTTLHRPSLVEALLVTGACFGSVLYWVYLGSLWPYALLQFGGLLAIVTMTLRGRVLGGRGWWSLILWYALAKVFEQFDKQIFALTSQLVSGHTLKHLASGMAGFALLWVARDARHVAPR
jgi:hypothetical protein